MRNGFVLLALIPIALSSLPAAEPDFRQEFPHLIFDEDFSSYENGEHPGTIEILRNSSHGHLHGEVREQAYAILHSDNLHWLRVPPLRDFVLEFKTRADPSTDVALILPNFRTDEAGRRGYFIFYRWGPHYGPRCSLHARQQFEGLAPSKVEPAAINDTGAWQSFRLVVEGQRFRFYHGETLQGDWTEDKNLCPEAGRVGFDIGGCNPPFPGPKYVDDIRLYARQPLTETILWKSGPVSFALHAPGHPVRRIRLELVRSQRGPLGLVTVTTQAVTDDPTDRLSSTEDIGPLLECLDSRGNVIVYRRLKAGRDGESQPNVIALPESPDELRFRLRLLPNERLPLWMKYGNDWLSAPAAKDWLPLPGQMVDGIALTLLEIKSPPDAPSLIWPANQALALTLHAASFAPPTAATVCRWSLAEEASGRTVQTGSVTPAFWWGFNPLKKLGLTATRFKLAAGVVPPGTYRLQIETWMDEWTCRRDDVPIAVGATVRPD